MKFSIASYASGLVLTCNDLQWVEQHFGDNKISPVIRHDKITLKVDPHGRFRWGGIIKGRRQIKIIHDTDLRKFGNTYIPITHIDIADGHVVIYMPSEEELVTPIRKKKLKKPSPPAEGVSLREAVRIVNHHVRTCPDLVLEIRASCLHALIEYS